MIWNEFPSRFCYLDKEIAGSLAKNTEAEVSIKREGKASEIVVPDVGNVCKQTGKWVSGKSMWVRINHRESAGAVEI